MKKSKSPEVVFDPNWPAGLKQRTRYRVYCDDNGRNNGTWLQCMVAEDGDVHVSMQQWEDMPNGEPNPIPSVRIRTRNGGGRSSRVRQALLWLAEAMRQEGETIG